MKKGFLMAVAAFAFGFANAQEVKYGAKAGADFTSAAIKIGDSNTGFYVGGFADVAVSEIIHVQPELLYVSVKDINQIQIPVFARFPIVEDFSLLAGPNFRFVLNGGTSLKTVNFGMDFGASFDVSDDFSLDAKYNWGLTNLIKGGNSQNDFKLSGLFFGLGYKF